MAKVILAFLCIKVVESRAKKKRTKFETKRTKIDSWLLEEEDCESTCGWEMSGETGRDRRESACARGGVDCALTREKEGVEGILTFEEASDLRARCAGKWLLL